MCKGISEAPLSLVWQLGIIFTSTTAYYPFPHSQLRHLDIPKLKALPVVQMEKEQKEALCEWANADEKIVLQHNQGDLHIYISRSMYVLFV